jgi:hypothetical protein
MLTCWIALTPCGDDAPGLEIVVPPIGHALAPQELTAERVEARFAGHVFERPVLEAGDALLLSGDALHRTHATPAMRLDRTSIELRLFDPQALPARLAGDHFMGCLQA